MRARSKEKEKVVYLMTGTRDEYCPVVELNGDTVTISDEEGNICHLSVQHWNILVEQIIAGVMSPCGTERSES